MHYVMCRPTYFAVDYAINPWMDPTRPVDVDLAVAQWSALYETYRALGQVQELFGRPAVQLQLVDPRYYHLDTALCVLDETGGTGRPTVAYLPEAFSAGSQAVLRRLFPDAVIASPADAAVLGLNAVG